MHLECKQMKFQLVARTFFDSLFSFFFFLRRQSGTAINGGKGLGCDVTHSSNLFDHSRCSAFI